MANRWAARTPSVDSPAPEAPLKAPDKMPMRLPSHRDPVSLALAPLRRLREDWRDPLLRNGYALIINVGATSVLGLLYWVLAARLYSPAEVGVGNAAISLMQLLAGIGGQLTFAAALARFIPRAGGG
ncbi:MAG: hypothetical protein QOG36_272, partial [Actinomycetota bacterium]|nr:hypothetical protein [Actinomycetota bacterium]